MNSNSLPCLGFSKKCEVNLDTWKQIAQEHEGLVREAVPNHKTYNKPDTRNPIPETGYQTRILKKCEVNLHTREQIAQEQEGLVREAVAEMHRAVRWWHADEKVFEAHRLLYHSAYGSGSF